jgi:hypothetical protein
VKEDAESQRVCLEVGVETKAQAVRVLDVFVIGPLMVVGGLALEAQGRRLSGVVLAGSGVATVLYNGRNYLRVRKRLREARAS